MAMFCKLSPPAVTPLATRRAVRAEALLKFYIRNHKGRRAQLRCRVAACFRRANAAEHRPERKWVGREIEYKGGICQLAQPPLCSHNINVV
jgi:hypothetical protein